MARTRYQGEAEVLPLRALPGSALRAVWAEGYTGAQFRRDLAAGFLVGIVALPLAMALAIGIGAPPQQGLYTAIVAGFLSPLLGGSRVQVVGPTAAFIAVLAPIQAKFGLAGLFLAGGMAGLILLGMGLLRLGRLIEFIPFTVTTGFTAGIATVIAGLQVKDLFGLKLLHTPEHFLERMGALFQARQTASWREFAVGLATLGLLLLPRLPKRLLARLPRAIRKIPAPLFALPLVALAAWAVTRWLPGFQVETIGSRFHSWVGGQWVDGIPQVPPRFLWPWQAPGPGNQSLALSWGLLRTLMPSAIAIAILGAIESLLSAVVADGMARTRHDPDSELLALGVSNLVTPFFGGIPATGAIARTATNFRYGGRTPISAMTHAVTILLAILLLAPLVRYLPMASLAALLLVVAWNMSELEHVVHTLKVAPRSDTAVLLICFGLTVAFDMVIAVTVGVVLASLLFVRRMAGMTTGTLTKADHAALPGPLPEGVVIYDLNGPIFFGAAERAMGAIRAIAEDCRVVIFRFEQVPAIDVTGLVAFEGILEELGRHQIKVLLVGVHGQVREVFQRAALQDHQGALALCRDMEEAFQLLGAKLHGTSRKKVGPIRFNVLHRPRRGDRNTRK